MRHILLAGAGLFAALTIPTALAAQADTMTTATAPADQQTTMTGWPADQQATFKTWPADYQSYYWTLTPDQQKGYWALNDEQRGQIQKMTPEQRTAAWQSIQAQLGGQPATAPMASTDAAAPMSGAAMAPMAQSVPAAPADAMNRTYPVCSKTVQDACQNRGEGGAPGVSRASDTKGGPPAYSSRKKRR